MTFPLKSEHIIKALLWTAWWTLLLMLSAPLMAETKPDTGTTRSISFNQGSAPDVAERDLLLKQADSETVVSSDKQTYRIESTGIAAHIINTDYVLQDDIRIYDTSTELISDFNDDGFYHRFSVSIDADTSYDISYIFARLYLSYEGGPWREYATSNNYHIYGDSELDVFVIETELADGFLSGYYDVRVELYNADNNDWLSSYGPYDDASLSNLPLQDSYYDDQHTSIYPVTSEEVVVIGHAGSISYWLWILPVFISIIRRYHSGK